MCHWTLVESHMTVHAPTLSICAHRCNQKRILINSHYLSTPCLPTSVPICSAFPYVAMDELSAFIQVISSTFGLDSVCPGFLRDLTVEILSSFLSFSSPLGHHISICYGLNICVPPLPIHMWSPNPTPQSDDIWR